MAALAHTLVGGSNNLSRGGAADSDEHVADLLPSCLPPVLLPPHSGQPLEACLFDAVRITGTLLLGMAGDDAMAADAPFHEKSSSRVPGCVHAAGCVAAEALSRLTDAACEATCNAAAAGGASVAVPPAGAPVAKVLLDMQALLEWCTSLDPSDRPSFPEARMTVRSILARCDQHRHRRRVLQVPPLLPPSDNRPSTKDSSTATAESDVCRKRARR